MKERPILFSGPMVRAILDGRKTQTRRVVKPQPDQRYYLRSGENVPGGEAWACEWDGDEHNGMELHQQTIRCPYGVLGDRLWVRETHALWVPGCKGGISYKADHIDPRGDGPSAPIKWRPSIHMPRYASRILLAITGVRVERLHDISEDDALAEGADSSRHARDWFQSVWLSINGAGSWDANPWVWVVGFQRLTP